MDNGEDRCIGANTDRQREYCSCRIPAIFPQQPQTELNVTNHDIHLLLDGHRIRAKVSAVPVFLSDR